MVVGVVSGRRFGLAALVLGLVAALLLHPRVGMPPLYDGIVVPPQPYRYESPPPNLRNGNQPPLSGSDTLPVTNGDVAGGGVQTDDNQVITFWGPGTLKAPGASSAKCTITPVANPPPAPSGLEIRGNVYKIGCDGQPNAIKVSASTSFHLTMRIPPGAVNDIRFYDGTTWQNLTTFFAPGGDPYASVNAPGFGEYAAMHRIGAAGSNGGGGFFANYGRYLEFYGILAFVLLFAVIAIVQEIRRRQRSRPRKMKNP